ncbi:universal stress protein [Pseudarthrobacter sp. P1]|uniref:universal stress protein n=1 Tax=Pseudarthrobacter sp. P1 TaxID=3418418 RepID=UPI003CF08AD1
MAAEPAATGSNRPTEGSGGPIVAGVSPGQHAVVRRRAADLAAALGVELVCAYVDVTTFLVPEPDDGAHGGTNALLSGPTKIRDDAENAAAGLEALLAAELDPLPLKWSFRVLEGEPARALGRLAEELDAAMIVVGTREHSLGARFEELLIGSVAVHLTHRQGRPVLVVPVDARRT